MDQTEQSHDDLLAEIMTDLREEMQREDEALAAARALPVTPGACPGGGLRSYSAGGYSHLMCPVCFSILGEWTWPASESWPRTPRHDRAGDAD